MHFTTGSRLGPKYKGTKGFCVCPEMVEILKLELNEKQKTDLLIQKSLDNGGADNVTVMLVSTVAKIAKVESD